MQFFNYTFLPIGNFTKSFCGFTSRKGNVAREEALRIAKSDFPLSHSLLSGHAKVTENYWPHKTVRLRSNFCKAKVMTIKSSQQCCSVLTQFWKYRLFKLIQNLKTILSRKSFAKMIFIKFRSNQWTAKKDAAVADSFAKQSSERFKGSWV